MDDCLNNCFQKVVDLISRRREHAFQPAKKSERKDDVAVVIFLKRATKGISHAPDEGSEIFGLRLPDSLIYHDKLLVRVTMSLPEITSFIDLRKR